MCQTDGNIFKKYNNNNNDVNKSNIISNKNKKNLVLPEIKMPSHLSSYQTKENTSFERNFTTENNIIFNLDSPHNKNGQKTDRDTQNNINNTNSKILESKKKEKKLKNEDDNIDLSIDNYLKDEFDSDANYEKNKKSLNMINTNIKYNFNPLVNSKIKLKNINNTKTNDNKTNNNKKNNNKNNNKINNKNNNNINNNINNKNNNNIINNNNKNNNKFKGPFLNNVDIFNNDKNKIFESIKEEKSFALDNDKSIKSSFYDEEEFIIINYDYSLNDKKNDNSNSLKINNTENINITGRNSKIIDFINKFKKNIYKSINIYVFNLLKKIKKNEDKNDEEDEKSMTDNDDGNYIPQRRILTNNITFNFAQKEMENNSNQLEYNSNNIMKYDIDNFSNDGFKDIELIKKSKNFYSP